VHAELRDPLVRLLDALEAIGDEHEEVYDTDVRERMADAIERRLIARSDDGELSGDFGMFSDDGNRRVREAVERYLAEAVPRADALGLDERARRASVWDIETTSSRGTTVDEFLGWVD
jgi:hypothetical protein